MSVVTRIARAITGRKAPTGPKPKVVILGSGWAGFHVAKGLDKDLFDVQMVSPANHFLFT
jgi:NADH:ubiquinone reductase (non-electrogenic)